MFPTLLDTVLAEAAGAPFVTNDAHLLDHRHESFDPYEVRRILRPSGRFITQQVGGQDNVALNLALQETVTLSYGAWDAAAAEHQLRDAGLEVLDEREAFNALGPHRLPYATIQAST